MTFLDSAKKVLPGLWLNTGSVTSAEIAAAAGFSWLLVDCEHGLCDEAAMLDIIRVASRSCAVIVRIPDHASQLLERALDFGAAGIMAPDVENAEQAAALAARMLYPPDGNRGLASSCRAAGFGRDFKPYFAQANQSLALICQIETREGVDNAEAIAAVPGVKGLFIGHSDLSLNLGIFGQWDNPVIKEAEKTVLAACARHGRIPGMLMKSGRDLRPYLEQGFRMVGLGSDGGLLKSGCDKLISSCSQSAE